MEKEEFTLPSSDGVSRLHCIRWVPDGDVRGVLQISHGMMDYIGRYDEFARYMAERGIVVYGHDHLGHGLTAGSADDLGFFADQRGDVCLIKDLHRIRRKASADYGGLPYFMLGHSMGSFFVRKYLTIHGEGLAGALIVGTGGQPLLLAAIGRRLSWAIAALRGNRYPSKLLHQLVLGNFNLRFQPAKTPFDWLSSEEQLVEAYGKDPLTQFHFSAKAYYDFFTIIESLYNKKNLERMPKQLPCIFLSGAKDPVGDFSKGVKRAYHQFQKAGMENLQLHLYENGRHEVLNERNRQEVYADIWNWMETLL